MLERCIWKYKNNIKQNMEIEKIIAIEEHLFNNVYRSKAFE